MILLQYYPCHEDNPPLQLPNHVVQVPFQRNQQSHRRLH
jgi:hypothetical protein